MAWNKILWNPPWSSYLKVILDRKDEHPHIGSSLRRNLYFLKNGEAWRNPRFFLNRNPISPTFFCWAEKKALQFGGWKSSAGRVLNPKLWHPEKAWIKTTAISRFVLCLFGKSWVFCQRVKRWEFQHVAVVDFFEAVFGVPVYWHGLGWVIRYTSILHHYGAIAVFNARLDAVELHEAVQPWKRWGATNIQSSKVWILDWGVLSDEQLSRSFFHL